MFTFLWRYLAHRNRLLGKYNLRTQNFFFKAWSSSNQSNDLLSLILFRRDCGIFLTEEDISLLKSRLAEFKGKSLILANALLIERLLYSDDTHVPKLEFFLCSDIEICYIPIVLYLINQDYLNDQQKKLANVSAEQIKWRQQFICEVKESIGRKKICIMGNSGVLRQLKLSKQLIDFEYTVRFNNFSSKVQMSEKLNVWVLTPSFSVDGSVKPNWVFLSGPELQNRLVNWDKLMPLIDQGVPIITLPLEVWRSLVKILKAPPSAGVAFLAFLHHMLGSWQGIHVAGFSGLSSLKDTYHISDPKHKPSKRHNWEGEAALLRKWQSEGLTSIHD